MKKDKYITNVLFVLLEGNVLALFPDLDEGRGMILSYMHVGQHGAASREHLNNVHATKEQYDDLRQELENSGYRLNILN